MAKDLPTTNTYHLQFDTSGKDGYTRAVKVTIEEDVMDVFDIVCIDFVNHFLYKALECYVRNKPSKWDHLSSRAATCSA